MFNVCEGCKYIHTSSHHRFNFCCDACKNYSDHTVTNDEHRTHDSKCTRTYVENISICQGCENLQVNKNDKCCNKCILPNSYPHGEDCCKAYIYFSPVFKPKICKNVRCGKIFTSRQEHCCNHCRDGNESGPLTHEIYCTCIKYLQMPKYNPLNIELNEDNNTLFFSDNIECFPLNAFSNKYIDRFYIEDKEYKSIDQYFIAQIFIKTYEKVTSRNSSQFDNSFTNLINNCEKQFNDNNYKHELIYNALLAKFSGKFGALLKLTTNKNIVYFNPDDLYWGVNADGHGENYLGKILMRIKDELFLQKIDI